MKIRFYTAHNTISKGLKDYKVHAQCSVCQLSLCVWFNYFLLLALFLQGDPYRSCSVVLIGTVQINYSKSMRFAFFLYCANYHFLNSSGKRNTLKRKYPSFHSLIGIFPVGCLASLSSLPCMYVEFICSSLYCAQYQLL